MVQVMDIPRVYAPNAAALQAAAPSLVMVGVPWCSYCKSTRPILDEVARHLGFAVPVYVVNAEKDTMLASDLGVTSYPTLFFVSRDRVVKFEGRERTVQNLVGFVCEYSADSKYEFCGKLL